jgi:phage shock protein A
MQKVNSDLQELRDDIIILNLKIQKMEHQIKKQKKIVALLISLFELYINMIEGKVHRVH